MYNQQVQELLDREAIKEIRYQFAEALDYKNWALLENLMLEEVETDFTLWGIPPQKVTREEFINTFRHIQSREGLKTQHVFTNFRIQIEGDRATSMFYQLAQHYIQNFEGGEEFFLKAEYLDNLVRTNQSWKISGTTLAAIFYTSGNPNLLVS